MRRSVLVTGGAGYIGSHVVRQLGEAGYQVVVLDDLSKGFREAVLHGELVVGKTGDQALVDRVLGEHRVEAVLHFAAHTVVPESVADPLKYYANNTCSTHNLLECCQRAGVSRFIFSSTAAVYGIPDEPRASEETPTRPINPYGTSKLMSEWMLRDLGVAGDMHHVILRYFNVAGCDPQGRIGQSTPGATLLIKVACEVAVGRREAISILGTDYPTPDGTGVRDYIHVEDLAAAHLDALRYLEAGGESTTLNCGYGHGYGSPIAIREEARRAGDPPSLVAASDRIREVLGWQARHDDLEAIVRSALDWEQRLPAAGSWPASSR
jgi:UDP-glucose 4-epimerase